MLTTNSCGENLLHAALQEVGITQYLTKARNDQLGKYIQNLIDKVELRKKGRKS